MTQKVYTRVLTRLSSKSSSSGCTKPDGDVDGEADVSKVQAAAKTLAVIDNYISGDVSGLAQADITEARQQQLERFLDSDRNLRHIATNPVENPHDFTRNELRALKRFRETNCAHTPHFLNAASGRLPEGVDKLGVTGGFAVFILMTQVPAQPLTYKIMKSKTTEERNELCNAFKTALM